jgi:aspartyl-tRNA(Asn)/glutamyl-tRNA(Gln) amidotransferase subunit C
MITKEQVQHIAKLARIELREEEISKYRTDLSQVLEYFDVLKEADTSNVFPMTHSVAQESVSREDKEKRERPEVIVRMFALAPALKDGFLKVKAVFSAR